MLKECPFCGGPFTVAVHRGAGRGIHSGEDVWSGDCAGGTLNGKEYPGCGASVPNRYSLELVESAINRRVSESHHVEELEFTIKIIDADRTLSGNLLRKALGIAGPTSFSKTASEKITRILALEDEWNTSWQKIRGKLEDDRPPPTPASPEKRWP